MKRFTYLLLLILLNCCFLHVSAQKSTKPPTSTTCQTCLLGYPDNSNLPRSGVAFSESEVLQTAELDTSAGVNHAKIKVWYSDEHALTLGVRRVIVKSASGTKTTDYPITPTPASPTCVDKPLVGSTIASGDQAPNDVALGGGRPLFPALFYTDITTNTTSRSGDWQQGGMAYSPDKVCGTWKGAVRTVDNTKTPAIVTITPDVDPAKNGWNLGSGDAPLGGFSSMPKGGYGAEVVWNLNELGLIPGHSYRFQVMVHDGDQNKTGGDAGEKCFTIVMPGGNPPPPPPPPTGGGEQCFVSPTIPNIANAKSVWTYNSNGTVTIRTTFAKTFVDNTYGSNAIGWGTKGHKFGDLVGSDHLQLALYDANGTKKTEFSLDYISATNTASSGYATLGVSGGEGKMISGSASDIVGVKTSISEDLNTYNYVLTTNSPATDTSYTPNPTYPNWIYDVWYEVTVKQSVFGTAGFGYPRITEVHASPSKTGNNTEVVVPGPCPVPKNLRLGNQVWNDRDGDGKRDDNEPAIGGALISLYTDNNNDNLPDQTIPIKTTMTDVMGKYLFTDLAPGRYIVSMPILPGFQKSPNNSTQAYSPYPDLNTNDTNKLVRLVGPNGPGGIMYTNAMTLTAGQEPTNDGDDANGNLTMDLAECGNSGIGDFVWNDLNGNGIQDAGEPGINNILVTITFEDGRTATVLTHNYYADNNANAPQYDGYYDFINLGPGTYKISFGTPPGLHASPPNQGDDTKDSDPVNGGPVTVTLGVNGNNFTIDAGFTDVPVTPPTTCPNLSVGNMVFLDVNGNGVKDATEPGIAGLTVKLYSDNDGNNVADGAAIATVTTAADGTYYFGNLADGKYLVGVTSGTGYSQGTIGDVTPDDNKDNDNNGIKTVSGEVFSNFITLTAGAEPINDGSDNNSNLTLDFGLKALCGTHCDCHNDCTHTGCGHPNCGHNSCKNDCKHTTCGHPNCSHNSCKNDCDHKDCGHPNCSHNSCKNDCDHKNCGHPNCGKSPKKTDDDLKTTLAVFPNPATTYCQVKVNAAKDGTGQIRITDAVGNLVASKEVTISAGANNITFSDLGNLKSGSYNVQLLFNYQVYNQPLMLVK